MSYERRRNPLGIIITGYGFAGPGRVARRGFRGFGNPGYFYGLGQTRSDLYTTAAPVDSTAEIELKWQQEQAKLAVEAELLTKYPELEAKAAQTAMDKQLAQERAAQQLVSSSGEPLYPEKPVGVTPNEDWLKAQQAEKAAYDYAQKATAQALKPPTSDDPKLWMAYEAALAKQAGAIPPAGEPSLPVQQDVIPSDHGPMPAEAPPSAKAGAGLPTTGAGTPLYSTAPSFAPPQVSTGGGSALLLGGAALALFLLLR